MKFVSDFRLIRFFSVILLTSVVIVGLSVFARWSEGSSYVHEAEETHAASVTSQVNL